MQDISWGNLPRYFFKDYGSGISINAASLPCSVTETETAAAPEAKTLWRTLLPPNRCGESEAFLRGFAAMKETILTAAPELNPAEYLGNILYQTVSCRHIHDIELLALRAELVPLIPQLTELCTLLHSRQIFVSGNQDMAKRKDKRLIILLEVKAGKRLPAEQSLYAVRKNLLQNHMPNLTITLPDSSSFSAGALYALFAAMSLRLKQLTEP